MAENQKINIENADCILFLSILAETNFIFRRKGIGLRKSVLLLIDENLSEERVISNLVEKVDAVEVKNIKKAKIPTWNYQLKVHKFLKNDKLDELQQFLSDEKSLVAVVAYGIVPSILKEFVYIFKISEMDNAHMNTVEFDELVESIKKFIRANPEIVVRELDLLKSSEILMSEDSNSSLFVSLAAAANVYCAFFRDFHSEADTAREKERIKRAVLRIVKEAHECEEEFDLVDATKKAVVSYFDMSTGYIIAHIDHVEGEVIKAVGEARVVLYDQEFYFISEPLFRRACKLILDVVSFIEVKKSLQEEGILHCNQTEHCNFTVKKVFVNAYGETCRGRFLKMEKWFLTSYEGLTLEDRKGGIKNVRGSELLYKPVCTQ